MVNILKIFKNDLETNDNVALKLTCNSAFVEEGAGLCWPQSGVLFTCPSSGVFHGNLVFPFKEQLYYKETF